MSQKPPPTDAPASLLAQRTDDILTRHDRPADIEAIPDDWNRGALDNPCHITYYR